MSNNPYNSAPDPNLYPVPQDPYLMASQLIGQIAAKYTLLAGTRSPLLPLPSTYGRQSGLSRDPEVLRFGTEEETTVREKSPLEKIYAEGGSALLTATGRTRGEVLLARATAAGVEMPEGMIAAIPEKEELVEPYMLGALKAAAHRTQRKPDIPEYEERPWPDVDIYRYVDMVDLPRLSSPVVERIRQDRPELVFACDRGARYFGLSVFTSWNKRYPDIPFPTIDGSVHFGRLSRSVDHYDLSKMTTHVLMRSGLYAEMMQRRAEGNSEPVRIMGLDDWVVDGRTIDRALEHFSMGGVFQHGKDFKYTHATLVGGRAWNLVDHIVADPHQTDGNVWDNNDDAVGISFVEPTAAPKAALSARSRKYREMLYTNLNNYYGTPGQPKQG